MRGQGEGRGYCPASPCPPPPPPSPVTRHLPSHPSPVTRPLPSVQSPVTRHPSSHLVLLAENREGYGNLSTLVTRARMDHPRGIPRVSLDTLARHAGGLFALTGSTPGHVARLAARGEHDA